MAALAGWGSASNGDHRVHRLDALCLREGVNALNDVIDRIEVGPGAERCIADLERAERRLTEVKLRAITEADRANVAKETGASGTASWLAGQTQSGAESAAAQVRLAKAIEDELTATGAALSRGELPVENAAVIADAMTKLPDDVTPEERREVEVALLVHGRRLGPRALRRRARRAIEALERKYPEDVDAAEDGQLRTEEEVALAKARLTLHDNRDGTMSGHFTVPILAGHILLKAIQQLAAPRRNSADWKKVRAGSPGWVDWPHLQGKAFVELLEHLPTDRLHSKVASTIVITVREQLLRAGFGAARTDTGTDLSIGEVRRLACGSGMLPAVLNGESQVLNLGRTKRYFQEAQRVALATVYETCAATDCDRPFAWCDLHHEDPWHKGGESNLDLAVPLCGHHHRRIHDARYASHLERKADGLKVVTFRLRT